MSTVPRVAAEWMVSHLPNRQLEKGHVVDYLSTRGLDFLNVKELKLLGGILYSMAAVAEEVSIIQRRLPSSAKKQQRIDFLRRGLFRDNSCTIINDRLLQAMRSETTGSSSTTSAAAASSAVARRDNNVSGSAASASASRKRPNNQISQPNQPRQQQQQQQQRQQPNGLSADDFSALFNAYYASQFDPPIGRVLNRGQNIWSGMPMNAADFFEAPIESQMGNDFRAAREGGSSTAAATADPQSTPQNPAEAVLLQQLLEMGFQKQEILDGIRQCRSDTNADPSADEVMLHLVSQREEAEEARKEDEVRLLSENQKKEESRRREQNQKDSLQKAKTGEDLRAIFPNSWVLNVIVAKPGNNRSVSIILGSNSRNDFLEFLKLEEKSRKWYGWVLPAEYFRRVGRRLKSVGDKEQASSWATFLSSEREKLRSGLYELKEQLKGQPKIFLGEKPKEKGVAAEIVIIDDD